MSFLRNISQKLHKLILFSTLAVSSCIAPAPALAAEPNSAVYCYNATGLAMFFYQHLLQGTPPEQAAAYLEVLMTNAQLDEQFKRINRHLLFTVINKKDVVSALQLKNILLEQCTLAYTQELKSY
jgi:DNA uptake protein ComE-like DNA-binding protein